MPQQTIGETGLSMFNDAKAAISMGKMDALSLWTNLVEAVIGSRTNRSRIQLDQKLLEYDSTRE